MTLSRLGRFGIILVATHRARGLSRDIAMDSTVPKQRKSFVLALVVASAVLTGCAYRGYVDPAFGDRHSWDSREDATYRQWEGERRFVHVDYLQRSLDDQWAYWNWRHSNPRLADNYRSDRRS